MFISRVAALFLTIIHTDLNSNVSPEREGISFDVKKRIKNILIEEIKAVEDILKRN